MSYQTNIIYDTKENQNFRTVLYTGMSSQLVVMNIPPGGEIGMETHEYVEQTLFFLSGSGQAVLDGQHSPVKAGDVLVVTPGTEHNVVNTGNTALKIYTVYAPPNHLDGRIHSTKADADMDEEDEAFGEARHAAEQMAHTSEGGTVAIVQDQLPPYSSSVRPGFIPDIGGHPVPDSPLENPEEPAPAVFDLK